MAAVRAGDYGLRMDRLADPDVRAGVVARLCEVYAGRPVILGPGVLAAYTDRVRRLGELGCPVLVLATLRGAGEVPGDDDGCVVVDLESPPTASPTEELRALDRLARDLPADAVAAIEAFDPGRRALWNPGHFVTAARLLGRETIGGRPAEFLAMEDKLFAEQVWAAAGVTAAPHAVHAVDDPQLDEASVELGGALGAVWSGDARDGFNGGGDYVRWVATAEDRAEARAFFLPRCDRVRVMPFLEGVPCSIHGMVLPEGTAVFRPVEIAILRDPAQRRFVYGGLSTWWDPPESDRDEMRAIAYRVGAHLQAAYGYRGAFGIDGVLTRDGFRPTELNTRMSAGLSTVGRLDPELITLVQEHLVAGLDTGLTVADLESLVPLMDHDRHGRPVALGQGVSVPGHQEYDVALAGGRLERSEEVTGTVLVLANTASGFFAKLDPCSVLSVGDRLAPVNVALTAHLDQTFEAGFGALEAAPDVR